MNTPIALVGAMSALIGALIGGTATLLAGRSQWRRESRREAYAQLLTASHEVRWWLEGYQPNASTSSDAVDPIRKFFSAFDVASVIASYSVQVTLSDWATVAGDLPELSQSEAFMTNEAAKQDVLRQWTDRQTDFHTAAKHELGIRGEITYRRRAHLYVVAATISLLLSLLLIYPSYPTTIADRARLTGSVIFWAALFALLIAASNAMQADIASRYRRRSLRFLALGLVLLLVALFTPVYFKSHFEPWMIWIHGPALAGLLLLLAFYWVSRQIEAMRGLRRWSKDRDQRQNLKQQEAE